MPREKFQNNVRLVLSVGAGALLLLVALEVLLRRSRDFSPDFLASVLLYGLTVLNLTLLLVLLFVLGRNLVRVLLERRRGVLGARLRMQLLLVFLLMAVAPSVLLIFWGSDLIQQTVDRWFNVYVERILSSSQALRTAVRESVAERSRIHARVLSTGVERRGLLAPAREGRLRPTVAARARGRHVDLVNVLFFLFPALLAPFGAVWLSLYLARRITTPLRLVAEGAERIAAGERRVKVDFPAGTDEFAALIASFNRMSERLARSEEEVEFGRAGVTRR